jgi:hypothetical protein
MEINQRSKRKSISRLEYYQLLSYQKVYRFLVDQLEILELESLDLTQEIDSKDSYERYLLGGITSDILLNGNQKALDDGLKLLGIVVEDEKVEKSEKKNMKDIGKTNKKKSGSKNKKKGLVDYEDNFEESPEMKRYLEEHEIDERVVLNNGVSDNVLLFVNDKEFGKVVESMKNAGDSVADSMIDLSKFGIIYDDEKAVGGRIKL